MQNRSVFEAVEKSAELRGISQRVSQITVSAIKQMPVLAAQLGGCVSLGQGIPSLATPEFIREAVIEELRKDNSLIGKYSLQSGMPELKAELAKDLKRRRNLELDAEKELFISCGGMEALASAISSLIDRGDEVILPSPCYASHIEQVLFAEGKPVFAACIEEEGWKLDFESLRKCLTEKSKAIVISNPVNPTGAVYSKSELRHLAAIALEHDLFIINDEAYDFLLYDQTPYFSLSNITELKKRLVNVGSFSKRFCMTGWRVGYMQAPSGIIEQALKVHDAFAICAPSISQYAALAALRGTNGKDGPGDESVKRLCQILDSRRNLVLERLDRLKEHFSYVKPRGGYYVFPKYKTECKSIELAVQILKSAKVITIPGSAFGRAGEGHLRFSFGADESELNEAFDRLDKFFPQSQSK